MEFKELIEKITKNPKFGTSIGNNCCKIHIATESKGKDGNVRVFCC